MSDIKNEMTVGEALKKIEQGGEESLTLLRMIEGNTKPTAVGKAVKGAMPGQHFAPAISRQRDAGGRFTSPAKTAERIQPAVNQPAKTPAENPAQDKTLAQILKGGAQSTWKEKKGDVADIAGRAALGPLWDIGKQVKEAVQATREKSGQGTAGELRQWAGNKFGKGPAATPKSAENLQKSNTDLKDAVDDLTGAVKKNSAVTGRNEKMQQGFPRMSKPGERREKKATLKDVMRRDAGGRYSIRPTGGKGGGGGLMDLLGKGGGVLSGLTSMIGPAIAVAVAGAAGAAIGTGISKLLDKGAQKLTGDKNATAGGTAFDAKEKLANWWSPGRKGGNPQGLLSAQFEGNTGSVNKDNIGMAYGKWQMNSKVGILGGFLKDSKNPYAKELSEAGPVDSPAFQAKWKEIAQKDPGGFEAAQRDYVTKTNYAPAANKAAKLGFNLDSSAVKEAIFSGSVQHGGVNKILEAAASTNPNFASLPPDQQISAFYNAREQYVRKNMAPQEAEKMIQGRYSKERKKALAMSYMEQGVNQNQALQQAGITPPPDAPASSTGGVQSIQPALSQGQNAPGASKKKKGKGAPVTVAKKEEAKPTEAQPGEQTGGGQKAAAAGPATTEIVTEGQKGQSRPDYAGKAEKMLAKADAAPDTAVTSQAVDTVPVTQPAVTAENPAQQPPVSQQVVQQADPPPKKKSAADMTRDDLVAAKQAYMKTKGFYSQADIDKAGEKIDAYGPDVQAKMKEVLASGDSGRMKDLGLKAPEVQPPQAAEGGSAAQPVTAETAAVATTQPAVQEAPVQQPAGTPVIQPALASGTAAATEQTAPVPANQVQQAVIAPAVGLISDTKREDVKKGASGVFAIQNMARGEKEAKLADIEKRRKEVDAKYDAGGLSDEEAGKQQMALDAEAKQAESDRVSKITVAQAQLDKTAGLDKTGLAEGKGQYAGTATAGTAAQATGPAITPDKSVTPAVAVAQGEPEYKRPAEPQPIQPEPPKVQGMEQLVASMQQQTQQAAQQGKTSEADKDKTAVIPNIPTEFSDTQLTLMAYDRV